MDDKPNARLLNDEYHQQDIINVFRRSEGAECSCIHDRVYGLLGMTSVNVEQIDEIRWNCFAICYGEKPVETFSRLANYIICRDNSLNVLFLEAAFPRPQHAGEVGGEELPSWVPDWRYAIGDLHTSCLEDWPKGDWSLPLQDTFEKLHVQGHLLGVVASRIKGDTMNMVEVHWTHSSLTNCSVEAAIIPPGTRRFDILALFEGAMAPALIRRTEQSSTYRYVGPVQWLQKRSNAIQETMPHFDAVLKFVSMHSHDCDDPIKPTRVDLV